MTDHTVTQQHIYHAVEPPLTDSDS